MYLKWGFFIGWQFRYCRQFSYMRLPCLHADCIIASSRSAPATLSSLRSAHLVRTYPFATILSTTSLGFHMSPIVIPAVLARGTIRMIIFPWVEQLGCGNET